MNYSAKTIGTDARRCVSTLDQQIKDAYAEMERCSEANNIPGYMAARKQWSLLNMKITDYAPYGSGNVEPVVIPRDVI